MVRQSRNFIFGRVLGWFDSKESRPVSSSLPVRMHRRARLALQDLEDRSVPATFVVLNDGTGADLAAKISLLNASTDPTNTLDLFTNFATPSTLALASALPAIAVPVDVIGGQTAGVNNVTINGGGLISLFDVSAAPAGTAISFQKLNFTNGFSGTIGVGGVLTLSNQTVTLSKSNVTSSTAQVGGGIAVMGTGPLNVVDSTISGNVATAGGFRGGGGIYALNDTANINIQRSTISGNSAGRGGAIILYYGGGLTIEDSTISGNTAGVFGAGVYSFDTTTKFTIRNSTFSGNTATAAGGAMSIIFSGGLLDIQNSTFTQNQAGGTEGGGGIAIQGDNGATTLQLSSNIISGNTHTGGANADLFVATGNTANATKNAIGVTSGFTLSTNTGNIFGSTNLQLDATLKNNGGPTATHAILGVSSVLVNAGENVGTPALVNDQRGPGYPRVSGPSADIGAYEIEFDSSIPLAAGSGFVNVTADQPGVNNPYTFTVTYSVNAPTTINYSSINNNNSVVQINGPGGFNKLATFVSASPASDASSIAVTYKFNPGTNPSDPWVSSLNGSYTAKVLGSIVTSSNSKSVAETTVGSFSVSIPAFYTVNTNDQSDDGDPNNGITSLREALNRSETDNAPSIINFSTALGYFDGTPAKSEILLTSPLPDITQRLTINGISSSKSYINANGTGRVLNLSTAPANTVMTLANIGISGGSITGNGGGLLIGDEDVTLTNVDLFNNTASGYGGGVSVNNLGGKFTMNGGAIRNNVSTGSFGGGLATSVSSGNNNTTTMNGVTISGNSSAGVGGGISLFWPGTLNLSNSTINNNSSNSIGGGIYLYNTGTTATISSSTIVNNSSASTGGGIGMVAGNGILNVRNSTLTGNTGTTGGGIGTAASWTLNIESSIVSGNAGTNPDISNPGTTNINFSAYGDAAGFTPTGASNLVGASLNLLPLANNGGPTQTVALGAGSLAINAGSNPDGLLFDQRGTGFPRVSGPSADIGAFEFDFNPAVPLAAGSGFVNVTADLPGVNNPYTFTVTYSVDAPTTINFSSINNNNSVVQINGPGGFNKLATFVSASPASDASSIAVTYKFNPGTNPGDPWLGSMNGNYTAKVLGGIVTASNTNSVPQTTIGSFSVTLPITVVVNTDADTIDADPLVTSLREAILATNSSKGTDIISFDPTYFATAKTITLGSALPVVGDAVTINGPGVSKLTVSGANTFRVLDVTAASAAAKIAISDLTLANGSAANGAGLNMGDEVVTLTRVALTSNSATGNGGAVNIGAGTGTLNIVDSRITGNTAGSNGGAVFLPGGSPTLNVTQSTLSGNSVAGDGGAVYFFDGGNLLLDRSTISGNTASGSAGGGAIYFWGIVGAAGFKIRNSTISGNSATTNGGGIVMLTGNVANTINIVNSTIVSNTAVNGGGLQFTTTGNVNIVSSIFTGNSGGDVNMTSGVGTATFSAIETINGGILDYSAPNNLAAVDATATALGLDLTLAANGGPTLTHAITATGKAANAGSNPDGATTDQRGTGFNRVVGAAADIGAYEFQAAVAPVVTSITVNNGNVQRSRLTTVTVNFASPVDIDQFHAAGAVFFTRIGVANNNVEPLGTVVDNTSGLIISPASGTGLTSSITLTFQNINNAGLDFGSLSDGRWSLTVTPASYVANAGNTGNQLRRLFGDSDNNGTVDTSDFGFFPPFGAPVATPPANPFPEIFDFNNNNDIDSGTDFAEFGNRFGVSLS